MQNGLTMSRLLFFISLFFVSASLFAQNRYNNNWINYGQEGWGPAQWLQIAPGKMGPNALPVPKMDYALVGDKHKIEVGAQYHQMEGDTAIKDRKSVV